MTDPSMDFGVGEGVNEDAVGSTEPSAAEASVLDEGASGGAFEGLAPRVGEVMDVVRAEGV